MAKPRAKVSIALRVPPELATEIRTFVRDNAGACLYLNMTRFGEEALRLHLERLRAEVEGRTTSNRRQVPLANHRR
jgi:hypothetical protein